MTGQTLAIVLALLAAVACPSFAQTAPTTRPTLTPTLTISRSLEEGKAVLVANLRANGKPVEDAAIQFYAKRTFGDLKLGEEKTLDDGTAAVAFPKDLPAGENGILHLAAEFKATTALAGARVEQTFAGGRVIKSQEITLPRALWAPQAPLVLLIVIGAVMGGVWGSYAYVVLQILRIRRGANP
jgi:hypothetical protein